MKIYELSKQKNIRDLGGLTGQDGKTIKYGRLFRGGAIYKMNQEDEIILKSLHITDIIDFRSKEEFLNHPEIQLEGVTYHNLPTFKEKKKSETDRMEDGNLLWFIDEGNDGYNHLKRTYADLIDTKEGQNAYRNFFKLLMQEDKVFYFHCSQGKDRAGIAAYLIESALGVSSIDIEQDYLLSNIAMEKRLDTLVEMVKDKPFYNPMYHQSLLDVFSAKKEYLYEAIDLLNNKYGGVISYLENVLNVDIKAFQKLYLE
ncbi:MAG: tyrosine-protein phosphatase [Bacilli bacterium]|nr:tyrosine-protein phosphatase [Bacilli bacterium]